MDSSTKQRCKYWEKCYRKNKDHLLNYLHPSDISTNDTAKNTGSSMSGKQATNLRGSSVPKARPNDTVPISKVKKSPSNVHSKQRETQKLPTSRSKSKDDKTLKNSNTQCYDNLGSVSIKRPLLSEPVEEDPMVTKASTSSDSSSSRKRRRLTETIQHDRYYFTKVVGHPDKFTEGIAVSFRDLLSLDGRLLKTWQFTYMVDLDWVLEEYPENASEGPIFLFLGEKQAQEVQEQIMISKKSTAQPTKYSRVIVVPVSLPLAYGTHHTKLMVLQSEGGVRFVIHTANLVMGDWTVKTQGVWVSPLCPLLPDCSGEDTESREEPDCLTFKSYLLHYLKAYNTSATDQLCRILQKYDMSSVTQVKLVGSVPGMHLTDMYGKLRLKKLLSLFVDDTKVRPGWRIAANCSSIGSLGSSSSEWLDKFIRVLQTTNRGSEEPGRQALFQLVFPTVDMIRNSLEGYCGGGCVPYQLQTHRRQPWLRDLMCHWESKDYGRSRVVPHIKTYTRISPDMQRVAWFLLTSANLSKAAWGQVLGDGRVRVRSYELGVLFINKDTLPVYNKAEKTGLIVPYALPPRPYSKTDKPWIADVSYSQLDTNGNKWPIGDDSDVHLLG